MRSRLDDVPQRIEFELVTESGVPEFVTKIERKTSHEEVLKWIPEEGPGITMKELMKQSGLPKSSVHHAIEVLIELKKVKKRGDGTRYTPLVFTKILSSNSIPPTGVEKVIGHGEIPAQQEVLSPTPEIQAPATEPVLLIPPFPQVPSIKEAAAQPEPSISRLLLPRHRPR